MKDPSVEPDWAWAGQGRAAWRSIGPRPGLKKLGPGSALVSMASNNFSVALVDVLKILLVF